MKKGQHLSALTIAAAFIGTVVGAGFATGQEVLQFFTLYGKMGFVGIILACILFCFFGFAVMKISRDLKADSHCELVRFSAGLKLGLFLDWFITISFVGVLVVMAAGAGAIVEEHFNLSSLYGSIVIVLLAFFTVVSGLSNVLKTIGIVVPFLLVIVLGVALFSIVKDPVTIQKINIIESLEPPVTKSWLWAALLYVSYNILLAVAILTPLGVEAPNKRTMFQGSMIGALGLGIGILAISLAIISAAPESLAFQVPMVFLAKGFNTVTALCYGLILLLEIYTTTVGILYGFSARVAYRYIYRYLWAAGVCVFAVLAAQLGFSRVITMVYPLMGFVGLAFLAVILWTGIREHWR
ncbi:MAG: hypothetical protein GX207_07505 [Peptococcaceae bacterium]|nr:hypothetical protein [Peptococcaceae bacterium]